MSQRSDAEVLVAIRELAEEVLWRTAQRRDTLEECLEKIRVLATPDQVVLGDS